MPCCPPVTIFSHFYAQRYCRILFGLGFDIWTTIFYAAELLCSRSWLYATRVFQYYFLVSPPLPLCLSRVSRTSFGRNFTYLPLSSIISSDYPSFGVPRVWHIFLYIFFFMVLVANTSSHNTHIKSRPETRGCGVEYIFRGLCILRCLYGWYVTSSYIRAELLTTLHVRGTLTACASSEPHEPKHQAWAGSLLTSCDTFREYTVYLYPPPVLQLGVILCQILFPSKPVVRAIDVSHAACKDEFGQNPRSHSCRS